MSTRRSRIAGVPGAGFMSSWPAVMDTTAVMMPRASESVPEYSTYVAVKETMVMRKRRRHKRGMNAEANPAAPTIKPIGLRYAVLSGHCLAMPSVNGTPIAVAARPARSV